jgi:hypothetical protein
MGHALDAPVPIHVTGIRDPTRLSSASAPRGPGDEPRLVPLPGRRELPDIADVRTTQSALASRTA